MAGSLTYLAFRSNTVLQKPHRGVQHVFQFHTLKNSKEDEYFPNCSLRKVDSCQRKRLLRRHGLRHRHNLQVSQRSVHVPPKPTDSTNVQSLNSAYNILVSLSNGLSKLSSGLSQRNFQTSPTTNYQAKLTPAEVTSILRANEFSQGNLPPGPVKSFETNSLRSNNPIEDAHSEAVLTNGSGYLFGIYDGHGGAACGQVTAKRLQHYIAAGLLSTEDLERHIEAVKKKDVNSDYYSFLATFNEDFELVQDLRELYQISYLDYLNRLYSQSNRRSSAAGYEKLDEIMVDAFLTLDTDMSREALPELGGGVNMKTLTVAMSGCVAAVTHIDGPHLHVASTGDCTAVIGSLSENETWLAKKLTTEHNSDNQKEVKRILSEHPESEHHHIIKGDRLLSVLAPLRAFGDFKFKWEKSIIEDTLGTVLGDRACPPNYKTPPYLTAEPEISYHRLSARDKFMVIGSDGLWDMMTPMQVIRLVGEHMSGKVTLSPLHLAQPHIPLQDIASVLRQRQAAMKLKPTDSNAATHLIRCCLGGTAYGVDHGRLSQMLSLPQDMVRMFRDDITITVVFFDEEYLRHC